MNICGLEYITERDFWEMGANYGYTNYSMASIRSRISLVYITLLLAVIPILFILYYWGFGFRDETRKSCISATGIVTHLVFYSRILSCLYRARIVNLMDW